jgi:hypothetical protein
MGGLFRILLVVGFVVKFWWLILAVLGAAPLFAGLLRLGFSAADRVDDEHQEQAARVARADRRHAWVLAGDDRGIYGDYPSKQIA